MKFTKEELELKWYRDCNQYFWDGRIFEHIATTKLLLFKELFEDWELHYLIHSIDKDLFDILSNDR